MNYFKVVLILLVFITNSCISLAEDWISNDINGKTIYLDKDSVIFARGSLFYTIKYYEKKVNGDIILRIQYMEGENYKKIGITRMCHIENCNDVEKSLVMSGTFDAGSFKPITKEAPLYFTTLKAVEILVERNKKKRRKS